MLKSPNITTEAMTIYIIVPFRAGQDLDEETATMRRAQLEKFVPYMRKFLPNAVIVIAEQVDDQRKFNRGKLLNAAFQRLGPRQNDQVIFHDVDLLPDDNLRYAYLGSEDAMHIARVWKDRYDSDSYLGGILRLRADLFIYCNGYPNQYWGWGGEDNELRDRIATAHVQIHVPSRGGHITDMENKNLQEKLDHLKRHGLKCGNAWELRDEYRAKRRNGCYVEGLRDCNAYCIHEGVSMHGMCVRFLFDV